MSKKRKIEEVDPFSNFYPTLNGRALYFEPNKPQCKKHNGTFYHIDYKNFGEEDPCLAKKENNLYFEDGDIESAPDGVYTWIVVLKTKMQTPKIVACRVLTTIEVGTKHANLLDYFAMKNNLTVDDPFDNYLEIDDYRVLGAGEFIKADKNVKFNLLSGTYMEGRLTKEERIQKVTNEMKFVFETLTQLTISVETESTTTYITEENIKLKKEDLLILLKCGAEIRKFKTKDDCKDYDDDSNTVNKGELITEDSLQHWVGGYLEIMKHKRNRQTKRRKRAKRNSKSRRNKSSR